MIICPYWSSRYKESFTALDSALGINQSGYLKFPFFFKLLCFQFLCAEGYIFSSFWDTLIKWQFYRTMMIRKTMYKKGAISRFSTSCKTKGVAVFSMGTQKKGRLVIFPLVFELNFCTLFFLLSLFCRIIRHFINVSQSLENLLSPQHI